MVGNGISEPSTVGLLYVLRTLIRQKHNLFMYIYIPYKLDPDAFVKNFSEFIRNHHGLPPRFSDGGGPLETQQVLVRNLRRVFDDGFFGLELIRFQFSKV